MTSQIGFPLQTVYRIVDVSRANPGIVTLEEVSRQYALSVQDGQTITINFVTGMYQLNDNRYIIKDLDVDAMTFTMLDLFLTPVDTSNFNDYVSGGQINIISFPGNPPGLMFNND